MAELSVPIPKNAQETSDMFTGVLVGAPNFEFLNSCVSYTITLDMMFGALIQGIENVAKRFKDPQRRADFLPCITQVQEVHALYKAGSIGEAQREIQKAQFLFRDTWKNRVTAKKSSDLK